MKLILHILLPLSLFSQNSFPDTLYMINGRNFPAIVTSIDQSIVKLIYSNNRNSSSGLKSFNKIYVENFGTVYESTKGFISDLDSLQEFIEYRYDEMVRLEELAELKEKKEISDTSDINLFSHWSFGVLYVPNYSVLLNDYNYDAYTGNVQIVSNTKEIKIYEAYFNIYLNDYVAITADFSYKSIDINRRSATHYLYDFNPENNSDNGTKRKESVGTFYLNMGVKYYFKPLIIGKVSPIIMASVGKIFTDYTLKTKDLYPDEDDEPYEIIENNLYKYIEDLNSPYHIQYGFGVEYPFSNELSLFATLRFKHTFRSSKYKSRYVRLEYRTVTNSQKIDIDDVDTHIGIGLNFQIDKEE